MGGELKSSFNGGEQSEVLDYRLDQDRARNGCRTLTNFQPMVAGGVIQRPGTEMIAATELSAQVLVPFNFNTEQTKCLAIGKGAGAPLQGFVTDGATTAPLPALPMDGDRVVQRPSWGSSLNPVGVPMYGTVATVPDTMEINLLQVSQQDDFLRATHPAREPVEIYRDFDQHFKGRKMEMQYAPLAPYEFNQGAEGPFVKNLIPLTTLVVATTGLISGTWGHELAKVTITGTGFVGTVQLFTVAGGAVAPAAAAFTTVAASKNYAAGDPLDSEVVLSVPMECRHPAEGLLSSVGGHPASTFVNLVETSPHGWLRVLVTRISGTVTIVADEHELPVGRAEGTTVKCLDTSPTGVVRWSGLPGGPRLDPDEAKMWIRVRASARIFTPDHANLGGPMTPQQQWTVPYRCDEGGGSLVRIEHQRPDARLVLGLQTSGTSSELQIQGDCNILTLGTWFGTVYVESQNPASLEWDTETSIFRNGQSNASQLVSIAGVRKVRVRFVVAAGTYSGNPQAILTAINNKAFTLLKVVKVVNGFFAYCKPIDNQLPQFTTPTTYWQEGAWSRARGYPVTSGVYQGRVWMAGTDAEPFTIWFSQIDNTLNWHQGTSKDTDPMQLTPSAERRHRIMWGHATAKGLLIGTTGSEWIITPNTTGGALTPTNRQATLQSDTGSAAIKSVRADDVVMFAQRGAFAVRESTFALETDKQTAVSLSVLAEHLLRPGIVAMDYAAQPIGSLWCVLKTGEVAVMTYERHQGVVAWWRFQTQGKVETVAVTYGADGQADQVWMGTLRNGSRYIERVTPTWWRDLHDRASDLTYLDAKVSADSALPDWAGLTVWGKHKLTGEARGPFIGLPTAEQVPRTADWWLGLSYEARLMPMRTEVPLADGSMQGRKVRASSMAVMLWNSFRVGQYRSSGTGSFGDDGGWHSLPFERIDPPQAGIIASGMIPQIHIPSRHSYGVDWEIRNTTPSPLNLLAVVPTWEPYG